MGFFAINTNKAMSSDFGLGPQSLHSHYCHEWCAQSLWYRERVGVCRPC